MNDTTRLEVVKRADERRRKISVDKGKEYTGEGQNFANEDADVLRNFKVNAERLGVDPLMTAALYFGKHVDSFFTFIRGMQGSVTQDERAALVNAGEGIISRLDDMRNYLDLMECLLWERSLHPEGPSPVCMADGYRGWDLCAMCKASGAMCKASGRCLDGICKVDNRYRHLCVTCEPFGECQHGKVRSYT